MKQIITLLLFMTLLAGVARAQVRRECGTPDPVQRIFIDSAGLNRPLDFPLPIIVKIFIHVFANDNGNMVAVGDSSINRQLENMRQFYAPHNICFIVAGWEQINNSDLNNFTEYEEYLLAPYLVSGAIDIFFHSSLELNNGDPLNGIAYAIPNTYLSVASSAVTSLTNRSTTAHEMGHCLGLYHTFQSRQVNENTFVRENAARAGTCKNCETEGDLLCDTDADRNIGDNEVNSSCMYTGNATDACGHAIPMTTTNVMTYGQRSCRTVFSNGQGGRARWFLNNNAELAATVAPESILLVTSDTVSAARRNYAARNAVEVTATHLLYNGNLRANFTSKLVTINPGAHFAPAAGGYTVIRAGTLCN